MAQKLDIEATLKVLKQGVEHFVGEEDLVQKLKAGKRLKVKLGVDPTRPDLTFGHLVVFRKLKQFQDLGHEAILLIGDYTALVGDPSGRSSTRPVLTAEEVQANTRTYLDQVFKVLDSTKTSIRYNSEWLSQLDFKAVIELTRCMTLARLLERDDFSKRYKENTPISMVELLYPLIQGYDSVALESDVELGGTDQLFNNLVGRKLMEDYGHSPQAVMTLPLLVGLDGVRKMSKSYDNYIAFTDTPRDMFGKIMSLSDTLMWDYYRLLLGESEEALKALQAGHPMDAKKRLAYRLSEEFYDTSQAQQALEYFETVFSSRKLPEDMPHFTWSELNLSPECSLVELISSLDHFKSKGDARRCIDQGGLKLNGEKISDPLHAVRQGDYLIQIGKRYFFKVISKG